MAENTVTPPVAEGVPLRGSRRFTAKRVLFVLLAVMPLSACDQRTGAQAVGAWAEIKLPPDCKAKQIASEVRGGVAVLCEDGRVFH